MRRPLYDDVLSVFNRYGFSWYINDYFTMTNVPDEIYAGAEPVENKGIASFDAELLRLFLKYQCLKSGPHCGPLLLLWGSIVKTAPHPSQM